MILSRQQADFLQMERFQYTGTTVSGVNEKVICESHVDKGRLAILKTTRIPRVPMPNMWSGIDSSIEEHEQTAQPEVTYAVDDYFLTPANFPMLNEEVYLLLKAIYDKPSDSH